MGILRKVCTIIDQKRYSNRNFVIISNNCWGAEIYKSLNVKYNTPFVGLFIYGPDYLKLLQNFDYYIEKKLSFGSVSKWVDSKLDYPLGLLEDIEIHFLHYKDEEEAKSKWYRRLSRMKKNKNKDQYFLKICDRDYTSQRVLTQFHELPFKNKVSFGVNRLDEKNHFIIENKKREQSVTTGVKLYKQSYRYIDVLKWIDSGKIDLTIYSKLKYFLKLV